MKKGLLIGLLFVLAITLTACDLKDVSPEALHGTIDDAVGWLGSGQLSKEDELIGQRKTQEDRFSGSYQAKPRGVTGRDVVFGGSSILTRKLRLTGRIQTESGSAGVRVRMNEEVISLTPDEKGNIATELRFVSGGNYIMVDYREFTGEVELKCEMCQEDAS